MPDRLPGERRPVVFFDGGCSLCRREIGHYQRLDQVGRLDWNDIHADPGPLEPWGIGWNVAMRRMHVVDVNGHIHSGAWAFVVVWRHLPYYRALGDALHRMPAVVRLMDRVYDWMAVRRWRSRCSDGACRSD